MGNKIDIYLCDDNPDFFDVIETKIKNILNSNQKTYKITAFSNGFDLITQFEKRTADIILLDIDMPSMTGFDAAKRLQEIKEDIYIIFITSYADKVFQAYEFQPFWYVRKSHLDDLDHALTRLFDKIDLENKKKMRLFSLIAENQVMKIDISRIKYIISYDHYIIMKDIDNRETKVRCKISEAERQLDHLYFVRVQNSVIVNCRFISKVNSRVVILNNGENINISRRRIDYVKDKFQTFIGSI